MADVEVVEEAEGMGLEAGIAITTTIVLVVALLLTDALLGTMGKGIFF